MHARFGEEALTNAEALRCFGGIQEGVGSGRFCRLAKPLPEVANGLLAAIWRLGGYRVAADRDRDVSLSDFGEASNEVAVPVPTLRTVPPFVGPTRNMEKGVGSGCLCHGSSPGCDDDDRHRLNTPVAYGSSNDRIQIICRVIASGCFRGIRVRAIGSPSHFAEFANGSTNPLLACC